MDYQMMMTKIITNDDDKMDTDSSDDDNDDLMEDFNTINQENSLPEMMNEWSHVSQPFLLNTNNISTEDNGHKKLLINWSSRQIYEEDSM